MRLSVSSLSANCRKHCKNRDSRCCHAVQKNVAWAQTKQRLPSLIKTEAGSKQLSVQSVKHVISPLCHKQNDAFQQEKKRKGINAGEAKSVLLVTQRPSNALES